jgi:hypothetical protein
MPVLVVEPSPEEQGERGMSRDQEWLEKHERSHGRIERLAWTVFALVLLTVSLSSWLLWLRFHP